MAIKNFVVKNGLTVGVANIDAATGNLFSGNANLGNLAIANFFQGNANALFNIQGANVVGTVANANYSAFAGVVTTNAQPNITSVGTLSALTVSGNANVGGILTDNYYYANGSPVDFQQAAGSNTQVQFNNNNDFGASANFTFNTATDTLTVTGNANVSGHVNAANINSGSGALTLTANGQSTVFNANGIVAFPANVSAPNFIGNVVGNISGNITVPGANTEVLFNDAGIAGASNAFTFNKTSNVLTVSGNISSQNATLGNLATANYVNVAQNLAVTGNISSGNVAGGNLVSANFVAGTLTTAAQPNITSVGTLSSLDVSGNIGAANVNGGNLVTANFIAGTLTTAAQPNVTSLGTLSSLDVTGNITTSANLVTDLIAGKTTSVTISAAGTNQNVVLKPSGTGVVDVFGAKISNVATPVASTDAATKGYVDAATEGLHIHAPCAAATPNTLATITSGTITYNNGTSGVGATLTTTGTYTTIDGVNIATVGTRVLVKNEANAAHNGIYVYSSATVLTRASDFDTPTEMAGGDFTFVQNGTLYNDTGWVMTDPVTTVGTSNVNFVQFSGAGTYTAGTGLTLNGTEFSISNTTVTAGAYGNGDYVATFTVNAQGQLTAAANTAITANAANLSGTTLNANIVNSSLTSVGTLGSLTVSGNASAGNVNAGNLLTANFVAGTLTTAAQPNITSVGTLSSLDVSGNASAGNVNAGNLLTANFVAGTLTTAAQPNITSVGNLSSLTVTGNVSAANFVDANLVSANFITGTLTTAAQPNITSVGTLSSLSVTANVAAGNLTTGGALSVTGNANVGNLGTAQVLASANVTAPQFISNVSTGTAPLLVSSTTKVANLNADLLDGFDSATANTANTIALRNADGNLSANYFIGNGAFLTGIDTSLIANGNSNVTVAANGNVTVSVAGNSAIAVFTGTGANINGYANVTGNLAAGNVSATDVSGTTLGGTLTTASQPNITSVGTLSSLSVTNTITAGNIYANSGTVGASLLAGTLTTAAQPNVTSVGNLTSLTIAANGNITMSGAEATLSGANLVSANLLTGTLTTAAQPNVTSLGTLSSLTTSGNVVVGGNVKVQVGITSNRANVAVGNTATVIDQFAPGSWRTAKYVISGSGDDGFQSVEALLVHDGVDSYVTIYGSICSNNSSDLITLSSNISGVTGNVTVYAVSDSDNCYVNLVSSYIKT
jgi:hypothetical protein